MFSTWEYRYWRRRRRQRRITLLLVVAALAAAWGASTQYTDHRPSHPARTRTHRPPSPPAPTAHPTPAPSRVNASPTVAGAGAGLTWSGFHGIALPSSAQAGPRHRRGGLVWGFADTPRGALLAAVNIAVRTGALWGPDIFAPTIRGQVTGPDSRALLRADFRDYRQLRAAAHVRAGRPAGRGYAAEAAYRFAVYSPAAAAVDVVSEGPGPGGGTVLAVTRIQVVWQRGDWRVIAPPGGDWGNAAQPLRSLAGYTAFANGG